MQQRHKPLAFLYAVLRKYSDDKAGYHAALLTYYGFLSLFPLLLVLTTITEIVATSHPNIQKEVIDSVTSYFPLIGDQLSVHIHGIHETGFTLLIALLFTFYGARGVASAFRYGINQIRNTPKKSLSGFPQSTLENLEFIVVAGLGLILAASITSAVLAFDHHLIIKLLAFFVDAFVLFWTFIAIFKIVLPHKSYMNDLWLTAICASVGLVVLQSVGGLLLAHQLRHLDALYSYFAVSLGLLFWIYLQAQVVYYSIEVGIVHGRHLWPVSFESPDENSVPGK